MQPAEVVTHGRRAVAYRVDDARWRIARGAWRRVWEPGDERLFGREPQLGAPLGPLGAEHVGAVLAAGIPVEPLLAEARRRRAGRVQLFGYPELVLEPGDDTADPVTGARWPDRYGRLIDYRHRAPGDPKLVWERNRLQELPLLCAAWLVSGDAGHADAALDRITTWLDGSPPGRGVAWANAFEPGIRAISMAVAFDALRAHRGLTPETARRISRGLWQHGRWIERDRSGYSSANNHLIGELTGLLAIALLVPELRDAPRWRDLALDQLAVHAERQILADGSGAEQSFAYAVSVIDLLLVAVALLDARDVAVPTPVSSALSRAGDMLALLVAADEPDPAFGDADDSRAIIVDGASARDARGVAAGIAARLGHPGARRLAGGLDLQSVLLFGDAGSARFAAIASAPEPGSAVLSAGGLVVLRDAGSRALFDVGPLGYLSIAAHGHADALQLVLSHGAHELVTDPGTGSYAVDPALRSVLRGTGAHATVTVDGADQSEQGGPFLWTRHANAALLVCDTAQGLAVGEHDGYEGMAGRVAHRRAVVTAGRGAILVVDRLAAGSPHTYTQVWPCAPGLVPELVFPQLVHARGADGAQLTVAVAATEPFELMVDEEGRWSRRLERVEPSWRCVVRARSEGAILIATLLVPNDGADPRIAVERADPAGVVSYELDGPQQVRVDLGSPVPSVVRRPAAATGELLGHA